MAIIAVDGLCKTYPVAIKQPGLKGTVAHFFKRTYRQVQAVRQVSFQIEPGEVVGFLGPNGAGKTTTLKMLTGLIHPTAGDAHVANYVPFQRDPKFLHQITLVMGQKQQLIWDLPTIDSLRINAAVYNLSEQEFRYRVGALTEMLSLETQLAQPVRKLSLGERMKAELLAALIHQPRILFLDEPTLGLDVNAQVSVRRFLQEYNQRYQATILLTSHYMADITALCQRVLLIHQGELIYDGNLEQLVEKFSPYREVTVDLAIPYSPEVIRSFGELKSLEGQEAHLIVHRQDLTSTVARILSDLEVTDLTIADPPVEEVIGRVFQAGIV